MVAMGWIAMSRPYPLFGQEREDNHIDSPDGTVRAGIVARRGPWPTLWTVTLREKGETGRGERICAWSETGQHVEWLADRWLLVLPLRAEEGWWVDRNWRDVSIRSQ